MVVPPNDPIALANAIIDMMRDEQRRSSMVASAMARTAGDLSWDRIAVQTVEIYRNIQSTNPGEQANCRTRNSEFRETIVRGRSDDHGK
jgi:hypothetical protein